MTKIELINEAFEKAERLESKLMPACFSIGGFTSPKIRHLMSNLGAISTNYLEIGVHRGATFEAAIFRNKLETATAVDNFTEFNESGDIKESLLSGVNQFKDENPSWILLDQDCWTINPSFYKPIDLYLFDGPHSLEEQARALTHYAPAMADEFIYCVDDSDWPQVHAGTLKGIEEAKLNVLASWTRTGDGGYHNGFQVFLLRK